MQRIALGVCAEPGRGPRRKGSLAKRAAQSAQVGCGEPFKHQPPRLVARQYPAQPFGQVGVGGVPGDHDPQHPVHAKPPDRERERLQRRNVSPMSVIDHHHQSGRAGDLQFAETTEQSSSGCQGIELLATISARQTRVRHDRRRVQYRPCGADELREHPVGEDRFPFGATCLQHCKLICSSQEPAHERGFANAGRPLDKYQPWYAATHPVKLSMQKSELLGPPNEQLVSAERSTVWHRRHANHCWSKLKGATRRPVPTARPRLATEASLLLRVNLGCRPLPASSPPTSTEDLQTAAKVAGDMGASTASASARP